MCSESAIHIYVGDGNVYFKPKLPHNFMNIPHRVKRIFFVAVFKFAKSLFNIIMRDIIG